MSIFDVWKFPLKCDSNRSFGIFDQNDHLVFNFCCNLSEKNKQLILRRINGEETPKFDIKPYFHDDDHLYYVDDLGAQKILLIRSWAYLTGSGGLHLDAQIAFDLQKEMIKFITDKMNGISVD